MADARRESAQRAQDVDRKYEAAIARVDATLVAHVKDLAQRGTQQEQVLRRAIDDARGAAQQAAAGVLEQSQAGQRELADALEKHRMQCANALQELHERDAAAAAQTAESLTSVQQAVTAEAEARAWDVQLIRTDLNASAGASRLALNEHRDAVEQRLAERATAVDAALQELRAHADATRRDADDAVAQLRRTLQVECDRLAGAMRRLDETVHEQHAGTEQRVREHARAVAEQMQTMRAALDGTVSDVRTRVSQAEAHVGAQMTRVAHQLTEFDARLAKEHALLDEQLGEARRAQQSELAAQAREHAQALADARTDAQGAAQSLQRAAEAAAARAQDALDAEQLRAERAEATLRQQVDQVRASSDSASAACTQRIVDVEQSLAARLDAVGKQQAAAAVTLSSTLGEHGSELRGAVERSAADLRAELAALRAASREALEVAVQSLQADAEAAAGHVDARLRHVAEQVERDAATARDALQRAVATSEAHAARLRDEDASVRGAVEDVRARLDDGLSGTARAQQALLADMGALRVELQGELQHSAERHSQWHRELVDAHVASTEAAKEEATRVHALLGAVNEQVVRLGQEQLAAVRVRKQELTALQKQQAAQLGELDRALREHASSQSAVAGDLKTQLEAQGVEMRDRVADLQGSVARVDNATQEVRAALPRVYREC